MADLHVQHVCGLVKQEEVRLAEECPGQGQPHSPASGEGLGGPGLHLRGEPQARQDDGCPGRRFVSLDRFQLSVNSL